MLLLNRPRITGTIICSIIVAQLSVHSALGACPVTPSTLGNGVIEEPVTCPGAAGGNAAVGMDGQGRFTIAWEQPRGFGPSGSDPIDIFIRRFDSDGDDLEEPLAITYQIDNDHIHHDVSVDMSYDGLVLTGWVAKNPSSIVTIQDTILAYVFEFDDTTLDSLGAQSASRGDFEASVGIGDISSEVAGITWSSRTGSELYPKGLTYQVTNELPEAIRTCTSGGNLCWTARWQSNIAMRANGKYVIAWADAEEPDNSFSAFNIRIQGYEIDGTTIGSEIVVNDNSSEVDDSSQDSPAVTIDESGNIVVAWVGTRLDGCENGPLFQIFGRRLSWDGTTTPSFVDTPFRVDSDDDAPPTNAVVANPAVALTSSTDEGLCGRFIVAWNVAIEEESPTRHEIHAQYFGPDGRPIAGEFRVNQDTSDTDAEVLNMRQLADGGQHTIDYGPDGQVVVVWTAYELVSSAVTPLDVYYTLLPSGFEEQLAESANCLKGDINTDGFADGADIQPFVDFLLGNSHCFSIVNLCGADCNCDGQLTLDDVPPFVDVLLGEPGCTGFIGCDESTHGSPPDCDENDVPDATQIMLLCDPIEAPENCDCNENGVPDGCDIADETSSDIDEDGRPDECQTDCNENSIPDSYEIEESMVDDCNGNSIPDECEIDCNENGVSDDCDVDPLDPDGDTEVSADCNGNGSPDECEYDCDENGVPDDCDLDPLDPDGDEWVDPDCNENGWPDSCDIDEGPPFGSLDANENEIPDECEEEEMMMGGGEGGGESMMSGGDTGETPVPQSPLPQPSLFNGEGAGCDASYWPADYSVLSNEMYAAWEEFMLWCMQENWGPDSEYSGAEQLERLIEKKEELGICDGGLNEQ